MVIGKASIYFPADLSTRQSMVYQNKIIGKKPD